MNMNVTRLTCDDCSRCASARSGFCARLGLTQARAVMEVSRNRRFLRGDSVRPANESEPCALVIRSGIVKLVHPFQDGRRQILDFLFPGDILFSNGPDDDAMQIAEASTDARACEIVTATLYDLVSATPEMGRTFFRGMEGEIRRRNNQLVMVGRKRSEERVATFLLEYARRSSPGRAAPDHLKLDLPRGDIADFLCLTKETVSRCFTQLRAEGLIDLRTHDEIEILDPAGLSMMASGDAAA